MYLCKQITTEVLLNLSKNVANVQIREHSVKQPAYSGLLAVWIKGKFGDGWRNPDSLRLRGDSPLPLFDNPLLQGNGSNLKRQTMRKYVFLALLLAATSASAQSEKFEPEYIGQVVVINADSTVTLLQKETMKMTTKSSKFGMIPIPGASLLDKTKSNLVLKGNAAPVVLNSGRHTFIVRNKDNNEDPKGVFSIISFETKKKERVYTMAEGSLLGGTSMKTNFNSVEYDVKKYGESSYIVTVDLKPGQYGFMVNDVAVCSTFGVK